MRTATYYYIIIPTTVCDMPTIIRSDTQCRLPVVCTREFNRHKTSCWFPTRSLTRHRPILRWSCPSRRRPCAEPVDFVPGCEHVCKCLDAKPAGVVLVRVWFSRHACCREAKLMEGKSGKTKCIYANKACAHVKVCVIVPRDRMWTTISTSRQRLSRQITSYSVQDIMLRLRAKQTIFLQFFFFFLLQFYSINYYFIFIFFNISEDYLASLSLNSRGGQNYTSSICTRVLKKLQIKPKYNTSGYSVDNNRLQYFHEKHNLLLYLCNHYGGNVQITYVKVVKSEEFSV